MYVCMYLAMLHKYGVAENLDRLMPFLTTSSPLSLEHALALRFSQAIILTIPIVRPSTV